jgi:hypothetical protein
MCGMYAVARLEQLRAAFGVGSSMSVGVVGSVAMWGQVVEHAYGYRGQLAYPDRIRLICRDCFFAGREGVPTRLERDARGNPMPVCEAHATSGRSSRDQITPDELQQMVLDAYAVDLLPLETLQKTIHRPAPMSPSGSPSGLLPAARSELRELVRTWAGGLAFALFILAYLYRRAVHVFPPRGGQDVAPPPAPVIEVGVGPFADDLAAGPPFELVHPPRERRHRAFTFGAVCGHRIGDAVQIMGCARARAELFGFYASPPEPRKDCYLGHAYTRKQDLSVCWLDFTDDPGPPLDLLRLPGVHLWDLA